LTGRSVEGRAIIPFSIKRYRGESFKEIRVAQFDPKRVRVVIESVKAYKPKLTIAGKRVTITLPGFSKKRGRERTKASQESASAAGGSAALSAPFEKERYIVVIDPGHGGKDAGAVGYKRRKEKDAVLAVAKRLKKVLQKRGFQVYLTRSRDVFIPLKKRTKFANIRKQKEGRLFHIHPCQRGAKKRQSIQEQRAGDIFSLSGQKRKGKARRSYREQRGCERSVLGACGCPDACRFDRDRLYHPSDRGGTTLQSELPESDSRRYSERDRELYLS